MKRGHEPTPAFGGAGEAGPGVMAGEKWNRAWRGWIRCGNQVRDGACDAETGSREPPTLRAGLSALVRGHLPSLLE